MIAGCKGSATPATQGPAVVASQAPAEAGGQTPVPTQQAIKATEPVATPTAPGEATTMPAESTTSAPEAGGGLCDNPYYPTAPGSTWTYSDSGGLTGPFTFSNSIADRQSDDFTLSLQYSGVTVTQKWACSAEGLTALQYGGGPSGVVSTAHSTAQFETVEASGVTMPASLEAGDQWQQLYKIQGTQTIAEGQEATSEGTVTYNFQALGMETVSVPAGTFEAMKIQNDINMEITVTVSGFTAPTTLTGISTSWYAPGVGWVKSASTSEISGGEIYETIELVEYQLP